MALTGRAVAVRLVDQRLDYPPAGVDEPGLLASRVNKTSIIFCGKH